MASTVSLLIAARAATAAAFARARADIARLAAATAAAARTNTQYNRTVRDMSGVWRDANGHLRDSRGRFVGQHGPMRTSTTLLGRMVDVLEKWTTSVIGSLPAMAMMAGKIAGITIVATPLIGALANLIPLIMLLGPTAVAAGLAIVGMKLATNGLSDALKAGLSGDTEAFEKALKKLPKSAADTIRTLVHLRDVWKPLQKEFQSRVFEGAASELQSLSNFIKPIADRWMPKLANRLAETRNKIADVISASAASGQMEGIWRNVHAGLSSLLDVARPLVKVFFDVTEVAAPRFAKIADYIRVGVEAFGRWISQAKESGKLGQWLDKAMDTFGKLKDIAVNVGKVIGAIFKASSDEGDSFLDSLVDGTARLAEWANGDSGQKMIDTIAGIVGWLSKVGPVINVVVTYMEAMGVFWSALWTGIKSIMAGVVAWILGGYSLLLNAGVKAFGWIPGLGDKLRAAQKNFDEFKNKVNQSLDGIEDEVVNIYYKGIKVGDHRYSGSMASGTYSSGIGGVAAGGPGGSVKQVNERGHEIVDFTRGMVYNSNQTKRMQAAVARMAAGGGGTTVLSLDAVRASSLGKAVASLLGAAFQSGELRMKVDRNGNVALAGR